MKLILIISNLMLLSTLGVLADRVIIKKFEIVTNFEVLFKDLSEGGVLEKIDKNDSKALTKDFSYEKGRFPRDKFMAEFKKIMIFFKKSGIDVFWLPSHMKNSKQLKDVELLVVVRTGRYLKSLVERQLNIHTP